MSKPPDFDLAAAHRYFSSECFNRAWDLIEKANRTPAEDDEMVRLSITSCWHWSQRSDCTAKNLSISYWQISHIYALLTQVDNARIYAQRCLEISQKEDVPPFYLGYAYEALARAEAIAGETARMKAHIASALQVAEKITDLEAHKQLLNDLESIQ
jgi:tetratricopeptide (TPR) repeat protein